MIKLPSFVKHFLLRLHKPIASFVLLLLVCANVHAGDERELIITPVSELSFGSFSVEQGGGSVVVDARSGACQPLAGAMMLKNLCERGQFEIYGEPEAQVMVELLPGSDAEAQIKNLNLHPSGIIRLGLDGKARINVGGELSAKSSSIFKPLVSSYMISVSYLR